MDTLVEMPVARGLQSFHDAIKPALFTRRVAIVISLYSALYFSDVLLRSSEKYFWYDELFTLHFSRIANFQALWNALKSGIDFNPPFFYEVTRLANSCFGEGLIATRLPEILGFWIFSLSLFRFVYHRAGVLAGSIAMLLPMTTGAYYYAYEARPHAIVLGFCGLALISWQYANDSPPHRRKAGLITLGASLFGTFMMHCYALAILGPFAAVEIFRTVRSRRFDWPMWLVLFAPALASSIVYVPLFASYKKLEQAASFSELAPAGWTQVGFFYLFLFRPCMLVLVAMMLIFALSALPGISALPTERKKLPRKISEDALLALAFILLPIAGVALAKIIHGPFFHRYFMSALAGISILIGLAAGLQTRQSWVALALAALLVTTVTVDFAKLVGLRLNGRGEWLTEPSTDWILDTTPGQPLELQQLVTQDREDGRPIAVLNLFDFFYLVHYAPFLTPRLYYVSPEMSDLGYVGYSRFLQFCPVCYNVPQTSRRFVASYPDFLAYGDPKTLYELDVLSRLGARLKSVAVDKSHFLAAFGSP